MVFAPLDGGHRVIQHEVGDAAAQQKRKRFIVALKSRSVAAAAPGAAGKRFAGPLDDVTRTILPQGYFRDEHALPGRIRRDESHRFRWRLGKQRFSQRGESIPTLGRPRRARQRRRQQQDGAKAEEQSRPHRWIRGRGGGLGDLPFPPPPLQGTKAGDRKHARRGQGGNQMPVFAAHRRKRLENDDGNDQRRACGPPSPVRRIRSQLDRQPNHKKRQRPHPQRQAEFPGIVRQRLPGKTPRRGRLLPSSRAEVTRHPCPWAGDDHDDQDRRPQSGPLQETQLAHPQERERRGQGKGQTRPFVENGQGGENPKPDRIPFPLPIQKVAEGQRGSQHEQCAQGLRHYHAVIVAHQG